MLLGHVTTCNFRVIFARRGMGFPEILQFRVTTCNYAFKIARRGREATRSETFRSSSQRQQNIQQDKGDMSRHATMPPKLHVAAKKRPAAAARQSILQWQPAERYSVERHSAVTPNGNQAKHSAESNLHQDIPQRKPAVRHSRNLQRDIPQRTPATATAKHAADT